VENVILRGGCRPEAEEVEDESIANVMDRFQLSVAIHITHWRYSAFPDISGVLDYLAILILTPPLAAGRPAPGEQKGYNERHDIPLPRIQRRTLLPLRALVSAWFPEPWPSVNLQTTGHGGERPGTGFSCAESKG
jgi:hypothetical protein